MSVSKKVKKSVKKRTRVSPRRRLEIEEAKEVSVRRELTEELRIACSRLSSRASSRIPAIGVVDPNFGDWLYGELLSLLELS